MRLNNPTYNRLYNKSLLHNHNQLYNKFRRHNLLLNKSLRPHSQPDLQYLQLLQLYLVRPLLVLSLLLQQQLRLHHRTTEMMKAAS